MQLEQLGPYKIGRRVGRGGMGTVYAGIALESGEPAAIKVLSAAMAREEGFRERFEAEIESLRKLNHPNIVRLFGFGEQDGHLFYAMELVEGHSLEEELQSGRVFDWRETTELTIQACRALKHAHDRGVIHRDIKPANLLLTNDGTLKLSDFGIAKLFGNTGMTADGGVLGTAEYMAPEQADGRPVTHRCDLYSLGGVMYALLARRPPFRATSLLEMLQLQRFAEPEPVRRFNSDVPAELDTIISLLLEKEPEKRIPTAMVLSRRLEAMRHGLAVRSPDAETDDPDALEASAGTPVPPEAMGPPTVDDPERNAYVASAPTAAAENLSPDAFRAPGSDEYRLADADPGATAPNPYKALRSDVDWTADATAAASAPQSPAVKPSTGGSRDAQREEVTVAPPSGPKFTTVGADDHRRYEEPEEEANVWISLQTWVLLACVIAVGAGFWYVLRPPTLDQLYERVMQAEDRDELADAESDIQTFLGRCPAGDPRGKELEQLRERIETEHLSRKIERLIRGRGKANSLTPIERDYAEALKQVELDPEAGMKRVQALVDLYGNEGDDDAAITRQCLELARRKLKELRDRVRQYADDHLELIERQLEHAEEIAKKEPERAEKIRRAVIELYDGKPWAQTEVDRAQKALKSGGKSS